MSTGSRTRLPVATVNEAGVIFGDENLRTPGEVVE